MKKVQLSDTLFAEVSDGDLFIYRCSEDHVIIEEVQNDRVPPLNEFTVEILALSSNKHFRFRRQGPSYWWEEVNF